MIREAVQQTVRRAVRQAVQAVRVRRASLGMLAGAAILAVLLWRLGTGPFLDGVRRIDGATLLAALALGLLTTVCSAWRWCLVARGLGIRLPLGRAVADYYRSLFLNAALPGGVLGDVHRAVRHGQSAGDVGRGVRAVVLERVAGQVVLGALGVTLLLAYPSLPSLVTPGAMTALAVVCALVIAAAVAVAGWLRGKPGASRSQRAVRATLAEARRGLLARASWPGVLFSSVVVLAGHLGVFLLAARAAGATAPAAELLPLMVLALLAMALPLNVGGWGPREGATAWAFGAAGLGAAQGLTVAVVYGVLTFAASLPGVGVLLTQWYAGLRHRRPQVEFEEGVLAEGGTARRRPERVPQQVRAGEADPRDAVADEERRDGDVEPVQYARVEEAGHGDAAALDEYAAESAARELVHQAPGGERGTVRQDQHIDSRDSVVRRGVPGLVPAVRPHHPQGRRRPVAEHPAPRRYAAARIEDDAHRVGPRAGADRQLGIVRNGGTGSDEHRVGEGPQPVQMLAVLLAGDVVGVAGTARDEPVEALPQLREGDVRAAQAERQITVGEELCAGRGVGPPEVAVRAREQPGGLGVRVGSDAQ